MAKVILPVITAQEVLELCRGVARVIPTAQDPDKHERNVVRLLFMTCAHESNGFRARRQYGFSRYSTRGAFGLWQCEWNSISRSLEALIYRPALYWQCADWLKRNTLGASLLEHKNKKDILLILQEKAGDPLSALFARLHYKWVPEHVPELKEDMAKYAKEFYNTDKGKARAMDYLCAFETHWPLEAEALTGTMGGNSNGSPAETGIPLSDHL